MLSNADRELLLRYRDESRTNEAIHLRDTQDPDFPYPSLAIRMFATYRRSQAMCAYVLDGDLASFRQFLTESVQLSLSLLQRFSRGENLLNARELFHPLALGDRATADEFARLLVPLENSSRSEIRRVDLALGMCLCSFVLGDASGMKKWTVEFAKRRQMPGGKLLVGYSDVFQAMLQQVVVAINQGLEQVTKLHRREYGPNGIFSTEAKGLCLWGVGLANLAPVGRI